jgi:hypothetical protein
MALGIIRDKVISLKNHGLSIEDRKVLKEDRRLLFAWVDEAPNDRETPVTKWRKARSRKAYRTIQDASEQLFLAAILSITPTQCARKSFDRVLESLMRLNHEEFYFTLGPETKSFLEAIAAEQGFAGNRQYLAFMKSLFPRIEPRRKLSYNLLVGAKLNQYRNSICILACEAQ